MLTLLVIYLLCQYFVEVPGCPRGYTGPGGLAAPVGQEHCTGGAHRYIDYKIFGPYAAFNTLWLLCAPLADDLWIVPLFRLPPVSVCAVPPLGFRSCLTPVVVAVLCGWGGVVGWAGGGF
jgi:hypothetical protein